MKHILAVDDDAQIRRLLIDYLGQSGFQVTGAVDGADARDACRQHQIDMIILDVILPDIDGVSLAKEFRAANNIPIIMLTTRDDEIERVVGLEVGADDYVTKPFSPRELVARIRAIFRRAEMSSAKRPNSDDGRQVITFADWTLDIKSRQLTGTAGQKENLTNSEFRLLATFLEHPGQVLSRDQLLEGSRRDPDAVFDRSIDYLILRLRRKLETNPSKPEIIKTEHGAGYIFKPRVA